MSGEGLAVAFDYVDPGSYLVHRHLEARSASGVTWVPLELRPPSGSLQDPADPAWVELNRFIEQEARGAGIPFRIPGHVPWSRKAHELALHAGEEGCFHPIHEAIFRAHFEEGRDIGRVDMLVELAAEAGMDASEVRTVLGVDRFLPVLEEARRSLLDRGVRGVPTLEAGGRVLEGFPGTEGLLAFLGEADPSLADGDGNEQNGS